MDEMSDWSELCVLLNANRVEYLVVGAHARAHYGSPRMTGDLDILVRPTMENAERVVKSLEEFGVGSLGLAKEGFTHSDSIVQLGYPPRRIDIMTGISGVTIDEAFESAESGTIEGVPVRFIGREDFIANKRACGRNKDLADIDAIEGKN